MYITCEQCNTMFRLDEKRLKPTGSKVRCSQCGHLFVAVPPASVEPGEMYSAAMTGALPQTEPESPPWPSQDTFDQELDGIDLAELDSILEQDRSEALAGLYDTNGDGSGDKAGGAELDESDLDLDFEAALKLDEEPLSDIEIQAPERQAEDPDVDEVLDLDMDFELAPGQLSDTRETITEDEDKAPQDELDMNFDLDMDSDFKADAQQQIQEADLDEGSLAEDIDMVLDDFEDVLSKPEDVQDEMQPSIDAVDEELSLDFDMDLAEEIPPPDEKEQEPAPGAVDSASQVSRDEPVEAADEFDISDLDTLLEEDEAVSASAAEPEIEEMALSLDDGEDVPLDQASALEPEATPDDDLKTGAKTDDKLDLSDLDGILDEKSETDEIAFSLDEDQSLEFDEEPALELAKDGENTPPAGAAPEIAGDDLDLSGFDDILAEDENAETRDPSLEELELSLDEESPLQLEKEIESKTEAGAAALESDDLDLGGFDALLDEADDQADTSEMEESELSLDDGFEKTPDEEPALELALDGKADEDLGELEALEFELDAEFEDKPVSQETAARQSQDAVEEDDEELDLSDIEKMLEDDTLVPETGGGPVGDLELDLEGGGEKWIDDAADDDLGLEHDEEIDLSDIEDALDSADDGMDTDLDIDEELELDIEPHDDGIEEDQGDELELKLELESEASATQGGILEDESDEIDLSDLDFSVEEERPAAEAEIIDGGDIELEFQIEEDDEQPIAMSGAETLAVSKTTTDFNEDPRATGAESGDDDLIEEAFAPRPAEAKKVGQPAPVRKKKGAGKSLIVILILALLGGGGYLGYDYVIKNDIQIPYLSDYINKTPKDPKNIARLSTLEINSKFIENENAGRIFVVTGKVRNGYTVPCKMIRLQGKLFTKGKVLAKTEQTSAGVMISDQELASQALTQLKQRLKTPPTQDAGIVAKPGQALPFMVLFSDLPDDLDEFAVELVDSVKLK